MDNLVEIVLQAIDNASDVFSSVTGSAEEMGSSLESAGDEASSSFDNVETGADEAKESIDAMADLMAFQALSEYVNQLADTMWELADKAGTVADSWTRVGLAAEGAGIPVDQMKDSVGALSAETGRAGGAIRESFIQMSSTGITSLDTMETLFKGASAQAFILGSDVESLASKMSGMAMKSTIAEKTLKGTGITVEELGQALGIQGATIEDVNAKWETMDTDARAAALGQAAAMNEGKDANEEYKSSWEGLQAQIDIAKGKLEVMIGNVLLPVLIPALEAAGRVLSWLGDTLQWVMDSPLGGFISVVGSLGAGLVLLLGGVTAITAGMGFFTASLWPAVVASWALISPWLPFIAAAALVVAAVYEIGKSFGWWDDASGMVEALSAGVMRLWDAFINHPDVQAAIQAIQEGFAWLSSTVTEVGQSIMEFFNINQSGNFDVVRALIDGIGQAWENIKQPIMAVINIVRTVLTVVWDLVNGNTDAITAITAIWNSLSINMPIILNALFNVIKTIWGAILNAVVSIVRGLVSRVVNYFRQLGTNIKLRLMVVVATIRTAIQAWINAAKEKVSSLVSNVVSTLSGLPGKIASALSGVVDAIVKPFTDAYNKVADKVGKIRDKANELTGLNVFAGEEANGRASLLDAYAGESANGRTSLLDVNYTMNNDNSPLEVEHNLNINLDLSNVPAHIGTDDLIRMLSDRKVLSALTNNGDFQLLDGKAKERLNLKVNRARGV